MLQLSYVTRARINFVWVGRKITRRASLCTLEPLPDCISEPLSTFSIAHQHFMQLVPPLEALIKPGGVCLLARINYFGQKIRETGISLHALEPLPDCISELPSTFSIAHQHFLQPVSPLDAMLQLSYVTREN